MPSKRCFLYFSSTNTHPVRPFKTVSLGINLEGQKEVLTIQVGEAMWARMKEELLYGRYDTKKMTREELKTLIWRYFIVYWNTRRICSANGGLPPMIKRKQYYESLKQAA